MGKIKLLSKKEFDKDLLYNNKYISAKVNGTEFEHRILKGNKRCNISVEPKNCSCYEYLSVILLHSILVNPKQDDPRLNPMGSQFSIPVL